MVNLLTGCRPGELARLKWSDLFPVHPETGDRMKRSFAIRDAKAKNTIYVPIERSHCPRVEASARRERRKRMGLSGSHTKGSHITSFDDDGLPAHGMMYRRTWRTVAADVGVDELIAHFCLGHIPAGISRGYVVKMTLASGGAMRAAQTYGIPSNARALGTKPLGVVWRASARRPVARIFRGRQTLHDLASSAVILLMRAVPSLRKPAARRSGRATQSATLAELETARPPVPNLGVGSSNLSGRASLRDIPCESHGIHTAPTEIGKVRNEGAASRRNQSHSMVWDSINGPGQRALTAAVSYSRSRPSPKKWSKG